MKIAETLYTFHLTALEIGILVGAMMKNEFPVRKAMMKEIDEQIYSQKKKAKA